MKNFFLTLACLPALSFASIYNCAGSGFAIDIAASPLEMKIKGNGLNTMVSNVRSSVNFDTVYSGNIASPAASLKLTIKDSSFGNPGDHFKGILQLSSAAGIKEFTDLDCVRGND